MSYISVDVETIGLIPGYHGLLSVGACDVDNIENQFHEVICPLNTNEIRNFLYYDDSTLDWWETQEEANRRLNEIYFSYHMPNVLHLDNYLDRLDAVAINFVNWLAQFEDPFFVAWPASFDYPFIQHLFKAADVDNPFNYRTIDVKSYACGKFNVPFNAGHDEFPAWLYEKPEFPHDALSDAISQAKIFKRLLNMSVSPFTRHGFA